MKGGMCMREIIATDQAPEAVGPYSQAVRYGNLLFLSGQVAIDPEKGEVEAGTVAEQTRRTLLNIKAVLEAAGSSMYQILKCHVYLADIKTFNAMNEVYREFFGADYPARLCVSGVQIYGGLAVEIDVIAGV
jgi:2-iminobutanoate/2-iminopropanoate deaminase